MATASEFIGRGDRPAVRQSKNGDTVTIKARRYGNLGHTTLFYDDPLHALEWLEDAAEQVRALMGAGPQVVQGVHPLELADAGDVVQWTDDRGNTSDWLQLVEKPVYSDPFGWHVNLTGYGVTILPDSYPVTVRLPHEVES